MTVFWLCILEVLSHITVDPVYLTDLAVHIQSTEETATGRLSWLIVLDLEPVLPQE